MRACVYVVYTCVCKYACDICVLNIKVLLIIDQLHASESMHGMYDITSGCSFAARKVL